MQTCTICGESKPLTEFHQYRKAPSGYRASCKTCLRVWFREYYAKNKGKISQRTKAHRQLPSTKSAAAARQRRIYAETKDDPVFKARRKVWQSRAFDKSPRATLQRALSNAVKRRPSDSPVTLDELMEMFKYQDGKCAVSGIIMTWRKGDVLPTSVSIDRIDSKLGYERSNVRLVCYAINCFKGRATDEEMLTMAIAIVANAKPKLRLVS